MDFSNFNNGLDYLCSETNFVFCRILEKMENNSCPVTYFHIGSSYVLADILFLILGVIISIFSIILVGSFKSQKIIYHKQRTPRGLLYTRCHVIFRGLSLLAWAVSMCVTPKYGDTQNVIIGLRACLMNIAQTLLVFLALTDMQAYPYQYWWMHIITIIISLAGGLCIYLQWLTEIKAVGLIILCLVWRIGAQAFYMLGCIPVCIVRRLWKALVMLIIFSIVDIGSVFVELYANGPLCQLTKGYLTAPTICAIIQLIYIFLFNQFFNQLKYSEVMDGLKSRPRRLSETPSSELNKPLAIAFSDYTYSYTYTEDESEQEL